MGNFHQSLPLCSSLSVNSGRTKLNFHYFVTIPPNYVKISPVPISHNLLLNVLTVFGLGFAFSHTFFSGVVAVGVAPTSTIEKPQALSTVFVVVPAC